MESSLNPAGMFRRAWGGAPVPVWGGMSGLHVWFYRINKNILPLSYLIAAMMLEVGDQVVVVVSMRSGQRCIKRCKAANTAASTSTILAK